MGRRAVAENKKLRLLVDTIKYSRKLKVKHSSNGAGLFSVDANWAETDLHDTESDQICPDLRRFVSVDDKDCVV